jgi:hypothetical protein
MKPRLRWVDNIQMDLVGIGLGGVDWIILVRMGTSEEFCKRSD